MTKSEHFIKDTPASIGVPSFQISKLFSFRAVRKGSSDAFETFGGYPYEM